MDNNWRPPEPYAVVESLDDPNLKGYLYKIETTKGNIFFKTERRKFYKSKAGELKYSFALTFSEESIYANEILPRMFEIARNARKAAREAGNRPERQPVRQQPAPQRQKAETPAGPEHLPFDDDEVPF